MKFAGGERTLLVNPVREMGLEPTRPKTQEPKSCAATITPLARTTYLTGPKELVKEPLDRIELSTFSLRVRRSAN